MNDKLMKIVEHAYNTTVLYTILAQEKGMSIENIAKCDIQSIPVIEKEYIMEKESGSLSSDYIVKAYREELMNMRSSGSTGKYLNLYWDKADFTRSLLPLWIYRKKYYGINVEDKMCFFYTSMSVGNIEQRTYLYKNQLGFAKTNLCMNELANIYVEMKNFQPKWISIQPSMAVLLCQCIRKYQLSGLESIEYIEFTGEMLSESVRKEVEDIFKCKTANQYGANETNSMAYECPYGNLHILQSNVYIEVLDEHDKVVSEGKEGNICVTSLTNRAMPFIRYKIGDRGFKKTNVKCLCGNCNDIIDITAGRQNDFVISENGEKINAYVFVRAIDNINMMLEGVIKQFQVEQLDTNRFLIKLAMDETVNEEQIQEMFYENLIESALKNAVFDFEFYEELFMDDKTGKLKYFINKLKY